MDGLMTDTIGDFEKAVKGIDESVRALQANAIKTQTYQTAMRNVRKALTGAEWQRFQTVATRHYKSGKGLRGHNGIYGGSEMVAWLHAIDASPWVLPQPDTEAAIVAGFVEDDANIRGVSGLYVGAEALAAMKALRVVRLETVGQIEAWLQRVGPCVIGGAWSSSMDVVARDTETIGLRVAVGVEASLRDHAVALVGFKPGYVRLVNDKGAAWGALGRAWMAISTAASLLADGGEAWGVVPVDLTPKRSAK